MNKIITLLLLSFSFCVMQTSDDDKKKAQYSWPRPIENYAKEVLMEGSKYRPRPGWDGSYSPCDNKKRHYEHLATDPQDQELQLNQKKMKVDNSNLGNNNNEA